jgi:hypothetical protein
LAISKGAYSIPRAAYPHCKLQQQKTIALKLCKLLIFNDYRHEAGRFIRD